MEWKFLVLYVICATNRMGLPTNQLKIHFFQLKIFFTKCLELGSILENGHISELLFMRNTEFKMQKVM